MRAAYLKLATLLTGAMIASASFAQQAGYDIAWGVQAVPLSPALSALIVLMMGLATWAFMRKRRGTGFMAAVAAVALGTMSYNADSIAIPDQYLFTISSQTGSTFVECPNIELQPLEGSAIQLQAELPPTTVGTTIQGGVTLTRVEPRLFVTSSQQISAQVSPPETCGVGTRVTPDSPCPLDCRFDR
jgi:hypothetical protein